MPSIKFIADDAGGSREIDESVACLLRAGALDAAHAFVTFQDLKEAYLPLANEGFEIGLHLNFSSGAPLLDRSQIETLVNPDSGMFWSPLDIAGSEPVNLISKYVAQISDRVDPEDLRREFEAQVEKFATQIGFAPAVVSIHHDLDQIEFVRTTAEASSDQKPRHSRLSEGTLSYYRYTLHEFEVTPTDVLQYVRESISEISAVPGAAEMIFHPAVSWNEKQDWTIYGIQRVAEHAALLWYRESDDRSAF